MTLELQTLLAVCLYGALQAFVAGRVAQVLQIHRNFSETAYLFAALVLCLSLFDGFGAWSERGAVVYAAGRALYLCLSFRPLRPARKWAWALSIAGIAGCVAELMRALLSEAADAWQ